MGGYSRGRTLYLGPAAGALAARHVHGREPRRRARRGTRTPTRSNLADDWQARGYTFDTALALLSVTAGIGGLIGGLLISTWRGLEKRRVYGVLIPMLLGGIAQIAYGFSPLVLVCAAAAYIKALMEPVFNAHSQAIWQSITPRELQGRVFSVRRLIAQATRPLGTAAAGIAAGVLDPGYVYGAFGLVWVVFCAAQLFNPYIPRVEDKAGLEQLAASRR